MFSSLSATTSRNESIQSSGGIAYREKRLDEDNGWWQRIDALWAKCRQRDCEISADFIQMTRAAADEVSALERSAIVSYVANAIQIYQRDAAGDVGLAKLFGATITCAEGALGYAHHDVQIAAGRALFDGKLIEMQTGEGKTLAASLPAAAAALIGLPVHVVTTNDYLAARDAATLGPVFEPLGLTVAHIEEGMSPHDRKNAYAKDIVYCSGKELGFDYLKDRISSSGLRSAAHAKVRGLIDGQATDARMLLRGLRFAIIDEADSVLIDEARTPLIISAGQQAAGEQGQLFKVAIELAQELEKGRDFQVGATANGAQLSGQGCEKLAELCAHYGGLWRGPRRREALISNALVALYNYLPDKHYLIRDDAIMIIDENTGRVHADRAWEHGLQQLIEAKEGVTITAPREVLARISYQRFFRRYERLAGMTGTGRAAAYEFRRVYGLSTERVPTHRPVRRQFLGSNVFNDRVSSHAFLIDRLRDLHNQGRPVLIGTRSVAASEQLADVLTEHGIDHQVLSAKQDHDEAGVIAHAGQRGAITVATSMAGRGTDIELGEGVAELGGLHVVCFERHDAARIDQQLWGRCARQGDPGSFELVLSRDDELAAGLPAHIRAMPIGERSFGWLIRTMQRKVERNHRHARRSLESMDERMDDILAFTGPAQ